MQSLSLGHNNANENHSFDLKKHDLSIQSAPRIIGLSQMFTLDKKKDQLWGKFLDAPNSLTVPALDDSLHCSGGEIDDDTATSILKPHPRPKKECLPA